jgi:outer membrane lipoprotein SlyB
MLRSAQYSIFTILIRPTTPKNSNRPVWRKIMLHTIKSKIVFICLLGMMSTLAHSTELMSVAYGVITSVGQQKKDTSGAQATGTLVGGLAGLATGSGKSKSNKALRAAGGAIAGNQVGRVTTQGTLMSYTVDLVNGGTVRVAMDADSGSFRMGDCVAVEKGRTANMRRVSDAYCRPEAKIPDEIIQRDVNEATECDAAKQELLKAEDEAAARVAAIKMELLCED